MLTGRGRKTSIDGTSLKLAIRFRRINNDAYRYAWGCSCFAFSFRDSDDSSHDRRYDVGFGSGKAGDSDSRPGSSALGEEKNAENAVGLVYFGGKPISIRQLL